MFTKREYNAFSTAAVCLPCYIPLFHSLASRSEQVGIHPNRLTAVRKAPGWNFGIAQSVHCPGRSIYLRGKRFLSSPKLSNRLRGTVHPSRRQSVWDVEMATRLYLLAELRIRGAASPLPHIHSWHCEKLNTGTN